MQGASKFGLLFPHVSICSSRLRVAIFLMETSTLRVGKGCLALLMGHCILGKGDLPQGAHALGLVAHCTAVTAV